ncbi:hypothetical protein QNH99_06525 [Pantoea allii]|uniref:DUF3592 domain-containing protein n=1 Tax=Pantoea allii TaxID=574096 RepID=A0ABS6VEN3_9GAMM|nr:MULTISPECIES: hypothetical protein [Pantoea]MBW1215247.1 hypothetical protein [Pantoea allii]MBW1257758.1 hypothetical protein [Pantoea allii]MBW1266769.1 hypothetical protein [Pantoea allii]MBW1288648.1 hypothetical protein [Pantoea allii]MDJ0035271.1 hypothetical protein [Pantoea allii]
MANLAMWSLIIATAIIVMIVIIGIRNSVLAARGNESTMQDGTETTALIINAVQHRNQNAEGRLSINLTVEFTAGTEKILTQKDVVVKIFNADEFKPGRQVTIRYRNDSPSKIVVLGNEIN